MDLPVCRSFAVNFQNWPGNWFCCSSLAEIGCSPNRHGFWNSGSNHACSGPILVCLNQGDSLAAKQWVDSVSVSVVESFLAVESCSASLSELWFRLSMSSTPSSWDLGSVWLLWGNGNAPVVWMLSVGLDCWSTCTCRWHIAHPPAVPAQTHVDWPWPVRRGCSQTFAYRTCIWYQSNWRRSTSVCRGHLLHHDDSVLLPLLSHPYLHWASLTHLVETSSHPHHSENQMNLWIPQSTWCH